VLYNLRLCTCFFYKQSWTSTYNVWLYPVAKNEFARKSFAG